MGNSLPKVGHGFNQRRLLVTPQDVHLKNMTLKDLLTKKDKVQEGASQAAPPGQSADEPEFTFLRTTTTSQVVIKPPTYPGDRAISLKPSQKRLSRFRRHTNAEPPKEQERTLEVRPKNERRLSERLHLGSGSRSASSTSVNIPVDLQKQEPEGVAVKGEEEEAQWEKRATLLAKSNPNNITEGSSATATLSDATGDVWHTSSSAVWAGFTNGLILCLDRKTFRRLYGCTKKAVRKWLSHQAQTEQTDHSRSRKVNRDVWQISRSEWGKQRPKSGFIRPRAPVRHCLLPFVDFIDHKSKSRF